MPKVDFFNKNRGLIYLKEIYQLDNRIIGNIFSKCFEHNQFTPEPKEDSFIIFLEETGIHPDTFDLSNVKIHCKHITTTFDNGESIRELGLKPVIYLLENKSALSIFLKKYGIVITPTSHLLVYGDKEYSIPIQEENNKFYYSLFKRLSNILYHDNGEIEVFINADLDSMLNYSVVRYYPEILDSISEVINSLTGDDLDLGTKWSLNHPKTMIVEFDVNINDMSFIGGLGDYKNNYSTYEKATRFFMNPIYPIYFETQIPRLFWLNEWLIRMCFSNFCAFDHVSDVYAGIKADVDISSDEITLTEI